MLAPESIGRPPNGGVKSFALRCRSELSPGDEASIGDDLAALAKLVAYGQLRPTVGTVFDCLAYRGRVSTWEWIAVVGGAALLVYGGFVAVLFFLGRRAEARALAGFIPDCIVLFRRLLADERIPRSRKALLLALIAYLALPFDLVPDFIPVAGQLDDAILVGVVLRIVLRSGGPELVTDHWPGPEASRELVMRLAFGRAGV